MSGPGLAWLSEWQCSTAGPETHGAALRSVATSRSDMRHAEARTPFPAGVGDGREGPKVPDAAPGRPLRTGRLVCP